MPTDVDYKTIMATTYRNQPLTGAETERTLTLEAFLTDVLFQETSTNCIEGCACCTTLRRIRQFVVSQRRQENGMSPGVPAVAIEGEKEEEEELDLELDLENMQIDSQQQSLTKISNSSNDNDSISNKNNVRGQRRRRRSLATFHGNVLLGIDPNSSDDEEKSKENVENQEKKQASALLLGKKSPLLPPPVPTNASKRRKSRRSLVINRWPDRYNDKAIHSNLCSSGTVVTSSVDAKDVKENEMSTLGSCPLSKTESEPFREITKPSPPLAKAEVGFSNEKAKKRRRRASINVKPGGLLSEADVESLRIETKQRMLRNKKGVSKWVKKEKHSPDERLGMIDEGNLSAINTKDLTNTEKIMKNLPNLECESDGNVSKPSLRFCQNEEDNLLSKETIHLEQTKILHSQNFENVNQTGNHNSEMKMMASLHEEILTKAEIKPSKDSIQTDVKSVSFDSLEQALRTPSTSSTNDGKVLSLEKISSDDDDMNTYMPHLVNLLTVEEIQHKCCRLYGDDDGFMVIISSV